MNEIGLSQKKEADQVTALVYFGRHGGGAYLTRDYAKEMFNGDQSFIVLANSDGDLVTEVENFFIDIVYSIRTPSILEFLLNPVLRYQFKRSVKNYLLEKKVSQILVTMPHYTDLLVDKICRSLNIRTGIIVHDSKNHPGEIWPRWFTIYRRVKTFHRTFVLSQYVGTLLRDKYKIDPLVIDFPPNLKTQMKQPSKVVTEPYFLVIGRMKGYKGVFEFVDEWGKHMLPSWPLLVIAGKGAPNTQNEKIITIDEWLTEDMIINLLSNCNGVILPYIEASQSGIVDLAKQLNVKIFLFSVGGLSEQIRDYPLGLSFKPKDYESLLKSLHSVEARGLDAAPSGSHLQNRNNYLQAIIREGF